MGKYKYMKRSIAVHKFTLKLWDCDLCDAKKVSSIKSQMLTRFRLTPSSTLNVPIKVLKTIPATLSPNRLFVAYF